MANGHVNSWKRPRKMKRSTGNPQNRWVDDFIRALAGIRDENGIGQRKMEAIRRELSINGLN